MMISINDIFIAQDVLYLHKNLFFKLSFCDIDLEIIINYNINEKGIVIND